MGSYQKFTLAFFRKRLQDGAYENATGANRAIGKTRELTDAEKDTARTMVRKHFGDSTPVKKAAKKAAKKTVKKAAKKMASKPAAKPAKKAAKKVAKAAKKTAKKVVQVASGKTQGGRGKKKKAKRAVKAAGKVEEPAPVEVRKTASLTAASGKEDVQLIELMGTVVNTLSTVVKSMESAKDLFPKGDLEAGVKSAHASMTRAVRIIDGALTPLDNSLVGKAAASSGKSPRVAALRTDDETDVASVALDDVDEADSS